MKNSISGMDRRRFLAGTLGALGLAELGIANPGANRPHPGLARGRAHTDYVQSQVVPSRVLGPTNSQPGVLATALSYNAAGDKAVTVIFKYPRGWTMDRSHYVNSDQEFLLLSGQLQLNEVTYGPGDYAYLPAGFPRRMMRSTDGATMLNFYEGEHLAFYADAPPGMYQPEKLILQLRSNHLRWRAARDAGDSAMGRRVRTRLLRQDATSGEQTWLINVAADREQSGLRRHTVRLDTVEEMFVIDGDAHTPLGVMQRGAYAWRAPGTVRGPYGSRSGFTALLRSKGGPPRFATSTRGGVTWDATYDPSLTEAQRAFAFKPYDPQLPL